ncbi:MAG: DUF433 domain-containing protein [Anaerolineaceae bacterium]|nr:DUF433 domain-containing protein [Anaerolineaceae bacterium]
MNTSLDDPKFPGITNRSSASSTIIPILQETSIRVQTIVIANRRWNESPKVIAEQYDLPVSRIEEALAFYQARQADVDLLIQSNAKLAEDRNE